ncbi:MAG: Xenobiotic-transporting ATPase [Firmicutes bacterium]|nr:Xenobiotic-transporting ATPase [Bacillota bacterium]
MQKLNLNFLKGTWKLTKLYWQSEEKWRSLGLLAVIVILTLGSVYLLVLLNGWRNNFYTALQNYDKAGLINGVGYFIVIAFIHIIVAVYRLYLSQLLELRWRKWLTSYYLKNWLNKRAYYLMQITSNGADNPDQRISEDLKAFVTLTLDLSLGTLKAAVTLISFIFILWELSGEMTIPLGQNEYVIPGYLVWVTIIYAVAGNWLTVKIGRPLVKLNFFQQRYEADFRFSLVRLRENSESIAFYGGETQEGANFGSRFKLVVDNFFEVMKRQKKLTWFVSGYGQTAVIVPLVLALPSYLSKKITLGGFLQISEAFGNVQDSLSYFVDNYSKLAEWQAVVSRLLGFVENVDVVQNLAEQPNLVSGYTAEPSFSAVGLNVYLPTGEQLINDFELKLAPGDSLLVTGPSGCGKSTLLRTLAGIWPFGNGKITRPENFKVLFLPQKPYLPLGSLRDILLYPGGTEAINDERIKKVIILCRLEELADKLDIVESWSHILSLGEQQRIAFARAILQQPDWLFLDEATSAMDEPMEQALYSLIGQELQNTAIISVGHRSTLISYHKLKLNFTDEGRWCLMTS